MLRAVELLGGGILGAIAGSFLCAPLLAHVFGPTTVTWDTSACPPGIYTVTSTATSADGSRSFRATTQHIRLPRGSLVQEFTDLPFGQYLVSAVARDARGRAFPSGTQTVDAQGASRGHQAPSVISAAPRAGYAAPAQAAAVTAPPMPAAVVVQPAQTVRLPADIQSRLMADGVNDLLAAFPSWKTITFVDTDDDGVMDEVRIEWPTGEVLLAAIGR